MIIPWVWSGLQLFPNRKHFMTWIISELGHLLQSRFLTSNTSLKHFREDRASSLLDKLQKSIVALHLQLIFCFIYDLQVPDTK